MSEWIKCSDRLPTDPKQVLVVAHFPEDGVSWVEAACFMPFTDIPGYWATTQHGFLPQGNITHWMPLPPKP